MNARQLTEVIARRIEPVMRRVRTVVARGSIRQTDDGRASQRAQVQTFREVLRDDVEVLGQWGVVTRPKRGAQCVVLSLNGDPDHPVVVATDDPDHRHGGLEEGETRIHNAAGQTITIKADGTVEIVSPMTHATGDHQVDGNQEVQGDATVKGGGDIQKSLTVGQDASVTGNVACANLSAAGSVSDEEGTLAEVRDLLDELIEAYNQHSHTDSDGGSTGPPSHTV